MTTAGNQRGRGGGATIAWAGSLEDTPLAEVIRRIVLEERSGELRVAAPPAVKSISFDRGFIVYGSSNLESEGLGKLLVDSDRISKNELALVGMLTRTGKKSLRRSLAQAGIVSEEELGRYVALQVNEIVLSLFSLARGTYRFQEGPCTTPIDLMVSLSAHRILLEGIRRMGNGNLILAGLPPLKSKVRLVDEPPFTLDVDKLRPVEKATLRLARHGLSIARIVDAIREDEGKSLRACYSLYAAGVLELVTTDTLRPRPIQEETGSFLVSEILRKIRPPEESPSPPAAPAATDVPAAVIPAAPVPTAPVPTASANDERFPVTDEPPPADEFPTLADLEEQERQNQEGQIRSEPEQQESSGWLSLIVGVVTALWSGLVGWFAQLMAAVTTSKRTDQQQLTTDADEPESGSWPMKDLFSEDVAEHASSAFVEEPDDPQPVVESLGVSKWSPEDEEDEPEKTPISEYPESELAILLGLEDEQPPQTPVGVEQHSVVDSSPSLEDPRVELEPEENPEQSMLDAIPLEEITQEEESPEVLIMVDKDAFADVPELGQEVAPLPHAEVDEAERVSPEVESDTPSFATEPAFGEQDVQFELVEPSPARSKAPVAQRTHPSETTPPPRRGPIQSAGDDDAEVSASPTPQRSNLASPEDEARLLRDVKLHFTVRDWAGAVPLAERLVELFPDNALYRGMLGRAMTCQPELQNNAEEHFVEALRLSPQDPMLHYWLGLYYKSFGLESRAFNEFRTTLRINPQHEGAKEQMDEAGKRRARGGMLKKLFG